MQKPHRLLALGVLASATLAHADDVSDLASANNGFACDLFAQLRERPGNLAFSPFSISAALAMTWGGARGETAAQMKRVLRLEGEPAKTGAAFGKLVASWADPSSPILLRVANRLFGEKTATFEAPYLEWTRAAFGAPLEPLDFRRDFEGARRHINTWIAAQTNDRIKDLLPPGSVKSMTRLVLTNAVYFLADWRDPFEKEGTSPVPFHVAGEKTAPEVPTMHDTRYVPYAELDGVKIIDVTYKGGAASMLFVLPDKLDGLADVEKRLTPAVLDGWVRGLASERVAIALPRFTIEPGDPLALGGTLGKLGMEAAFSQRQADFTGIANPPDAGERLFISEVFHKAFVRVDEKGTEAAAATAVSMEGTGAAPGKPKVWNGDHPFLFILRDTGSGMILFMGRVSRP